MFGVFVALYSEKMVDAISWLSFFGVLGRDSEPETCALNAKIMISKFDLIWPDMDLTSAGQQSSRMTS